MDIGEGMFSGGYGRYKSDDQRSLSSISSLTSRSVATNRMAVLQRAARQQEVLQSTHKPQMRQQPPATEQKAQFPHHKAGRVKVGIRCRPPFEDEIEGDTFQPSVHITPAAQSGNGLAIATLTLLSGKHRDFYFDFGFGPEAGQDEVYETLARPVVQDVLRGFNGTIFAYGQTGTGKTYTMGILEMVNNEHAGIVPRSLAQIFNHVHSTKHAQCVVTMSFLQLYRETIQDLLSPSYTDRQEMLSIREDPTKGFYVEGLHEYTVRTYEEAEALVNLGLQNRAMAPTLMNTTSSRSHTILTVKIEQREYAMDSYDRNQPVSFSRTLRSKLLLVDLAGSERVHRTVSKGLRLDEAKSINTSLSALGNVIAALASATPGHVPYRDSKLTRLLQDSLGGTASTGSHVPEEQALIATVGPSAISGGETLSTLLFASRCMSVKADPVRHEEVNYAEMYARLQARYASLEREYMQKLDEQEARHQAQLKTLQHQLQHAAHPSLQTQASTERMMDSRVDELLEIFAKETNAQDWQLYQAMSGKQGVAAVTLVYTTLCSALQVTVEVLKENKARHEQYVAAMAKEMKEAAEQEELRANEASAMANADPIRGSQTAQLLGPHLAPISRAAALEQVQQSFPTNNVAPMDDYLGTQWEGELGVVIADPLNGQEPPQLSDFESPQHLFEALYELKTALTANLQALSSLMSAKDSNFNQLKQELVSQTVDKRQREEEVVNWSYVLKYLLATNSKLRKQLREEQQLSAYAPLPGTPNASQQQQQQQQQQQLAGQAPLSPSPRKHMSPVERIMLRNKLEHDPAITATNKLGYRAIRSREAISHNRAVDVELQQYESNVFTTPQPDYTRRRAATESLNTHMTPRTVQSETTSSNSVGRMITERLSITDEAEAQATTAVIERIMQITPQQLERMSPDTRAKIQQLKQVLQLDQLAAANEANRRPPQQAQRRARSAEPRDRSAAIRTPNRPASARGQLRGYAPPRTPLVAGSSAGRMSARQPVIDSADDNYSAIDEMDGL